MKFFSPSLPFSLLFVCLAVSATASAQTTTGPVGQGDFLPGAPPPGPPPNGLPPGQLPTRDFGPPHQAFSAHGGPEEVSSTQSTMHGGLQLGPPGRWWDDAAFARSLGLSTQQQRAMDAAFEQSRPGLLSLYHSYLQEQAALEGLITSKPLNESALMAKIDSVGRVRIALEQANARLLLKIRALMSPEQVIRLDSHR